VTITPSDFIRNGPNEIEARAKLIFEVLAAQSEIVILFDEIDRFVLERTLPDYGKQEVIFQLMTPSMLTKLIDLRSAKRAVFVVSVNYGERIDGAAKRRGRIDDIFVLPPPNIAGRLTILARLLQKRFDATPLTDLKSNDALKGIAKETPLWVFGELAQLVQDACDEAPKGSCIDAVNKMAEVVSQRPAAITLASYKTRFDQGSPKPNVEFLTLLYLVLETGREPEGADRELALTVLKNVVGGGAATEALTEALGVGDTHEMVTVISGFHAKTATEGNTA
jgi:SpoVK/Ycf46/Vps4 family AAA+-type ATPase